MHISLIPMLICPACSGGLIASDSVVTCDDCRQVYCPTASADQWDFRLQAPKEYKISYRLGQNRHPCARIYETLPFSSTREKSDARSIEASLTYGNRLNDALISYFPVAKSRDAWMLDLGCGSRNFESLCKDITGFKYIGIDYSGSAPDLLADAHALPFRDKSFEFILSIAVLEHLEIPEVAVAELFRVLKPGGTFVGTVAFLEPFHMNSYYHMSHLGVVRLLSHAGFEIVALAPNAEWSGTRAQAEMTLFPGLPLSIKRSMTSAISPISKALWAFRRLFRQDDCGSNLQRLLETTGGFRFVVRRPA